MAETILTILRRDLLEVGAGQWEEIAREVGVAKSLPRKIAYGDRSNPGVETIQPLVSYFAARKALAAARSAASETTEA